MKKNKYIMGVLVIMAVLMLGSISGCSKSKLNKENEVSKEQGTESDQILENSDLDEPLHLVDEYLSEEEDKPELNANSSTKKPQASEQPTGDDEEEDEDVTDSDLEETGGSSGTADEDNKEDEDEPPATNLKPSDNTESGWGEVEF